MFHSFILKTSRKNTSRPGHFKPVHHGSSLQINFVLFTLYLNTRVLEKRFFEIVVNKCEKINIYYFKTKLKSSQTHIFYWMLGKIQIGRLHELDHYWNRKQPIFDIAKKYKNIYSQMLLITSFPKTYK